MQSKAEYVNARKTSFSVNKKPADKVNDCLTSDQSSTSDATRPMVTHIKVLLQPKYDFHTPVK